MVHLRFNYLIGNDYSTRAIGCKLADRALLAVNQRDALNYSPAVVDYPLYGHAVIAVDGPLALFAAVAGVAPDRGVPPLELLSAVVVVGAVVTRVEALVEGSLALELAAGVVQLPRAVLIPVPEVAFTHRALLRDGKSDAPRPCFATVDGKVG